MNWIAKEINVSAERQTVWYEGVYAVNDFRIRLVVKADTYESQSYANAEVWKNDALEWSPVAKIRGVDLKVEKDLVYAPKSRHLRAAFAADICNLKKKVEAVLS